jgi:hypothetical protein
VRDENVGAGVDAFAAIFERVIGDVLYVGAAFGGEQAIAALFMAMEACDHAVGHAARISHLPDVFAQIDGVWLGLDREFVAEAECLAQEIMRLGRDLLFGVALVPATFELGLPADALADFAQLGERRGIDLVDLLVAERVGRLI